MDKILRTKDFFYTGEYVTALFCAESREMNLHSHEFWEISYVYEGRGFHHTSLQDKAKLKENDFVLISPSAKHCITSPAKDNGSLVRVCNCLITPEYMQEIIDSHLQTDTFCTYSLNRLLTASAPICLQLSDDSGSVYHTLMSLAHESRNFTTGSEIIIRNTLCNLLIQCSRIYEAKLSGIPVINNKNEAMDELIKYIKSNYGGNLSLQFLAEHAHLSREHLSRCFKEYTGTNLSTFIRDIRIEKASQLLRSGTHSVSDISIYCGYPTISNFQKAFKAATGISPSEYRNQNR